MKQILIISCFFMWACTNVSQGSVLEEMENSFKSLIKKQLKNDSAEAERYLNNEVKIILTKRKNFSSEFSFNNMKEFVLVEIFNPEIDDLYKGFIKEGNNYYFFQSNLKDESSYEKTQLGALRKEYNMAACLLVKSENNIDALIKEKDDSTFHFTAYITKVKNGEVESFWVKNVCSLD